MTKPTPSRPPALASQFAAFDGGNLLVQLSRKGSQQLKNGEIDAAQQTYQEMIELEPTNTYALVGMARVAGRHAQWKEAERWYLRCLEVAPYNHVALIGLADTYRADAQLPKALSIWKKCLKLDANDLSVLTRMADAYRISGQCELACQTYQKALEIDPQHAFALIGLGYVHYDMKDYAQALTCWNSASLADPTRVDVRLLTNLGNCERKLLHFEAALPYYQRALALESNNTYALYGLADCHRGLHQPERSLQYWRQILALQPNNKVVLTRAGDALRLLGRFDDALASYQLALAQGADLYATLGLAKVHQARGQAQSALQLLEQALHTDPGNERIKRLIDDCRRLADTASPAV